MGLRAALENLFISFEHATGIPINQCSWQHLADWVLESRGFGDSILGRRV